MVASSTGGGSTGPDEGGAARPERGRVLVVEDDPRTMQFVTMALERAGFEVLTATEATGALDRLDHGGVDVLLADIGLPGRSGFELVVEARRLVPGLAIALMTADASVDAAVTALRSDVDDFLPKPISPTALVTQVERLVERHRTRVPGPVRRVLAVGAHPDDVEIGVGGILLGHGQAGDEVTILTLSHGARGGDAGIRATEAARAAGLLGAELVLGDLEDTRIPVSDPTVRTIEEVIGRVRPGIVYTHTISDLHQDHRNVNRATMVAARDVPSVYCYESPSATVTFGPVRFVGIDPYLGRKLEAINAYGSQTEMRSYLDEDLIRSTARYWGRYGQSRYCEPLEVVRDRPSSFEAEHD